MSKREPDIKIEHNAVPQPRGAHESVTNYCFRLTYQRKSSVSIPPRGEHESDLDFINRVMMSKDVK